MSPVTSLPQGMSPVTSLSPKGMSPRHALGAGGQVGETYLASDSERGDPAVEAAVVALRRDMVCV